ADVYKTRDENEAARTVRARAAGIAGRSECAALLVAVAEVRYLDGDRSFRPHLVAGTDSVAVVVPVESNGRGRGHRRVQRKGRLVRDVAQRDGPDRGAARRDP